MENYVARAMQIVDLFDDEILRLHAIENKRGYYIPNWNIQTLFGKRELKSVYMLPANDEMEMARNHVRVKSILDKDKIFLVDVEDKNGDLFKKPVNFSDMDDVHAFDFNVKRKYTIKDFIYVGDGGSGTKGKLKKALMEAI